ncbi:hypothetical protein Fcan01_26646 [Folsomia candida]|uniref:Reverse transcriptase domain-containing protein n=1 Tax=Folsomia candida TaxID=158441 RepID=A0A226CZ80_FOLCA|nr:hypothetical protein Fcan01_26646 [Folsomia candida]
MRGWKDVINFITNHNGVDMTTRLRELQKITQKIFQLENNIIFLKRCKTEGLVPKGMRIKNNLSMTDHTEDLYENFQFKLLKQTIRNNYKYLHQKIKMYRGSMNYFKTNFINVFPDIENLIRDKKERLTSMIKERQLQKFNYLMKCQKKAIQSKIQQKIKTGKYATVINLANKSLTKDEETLLKLGMNFAIPPHNVAEQIIDTVIAVERVVNDANIPETKKENIRYETTKIINSEKRKVAEVDHKMNKWIKTTIRKLKDDKNIIITKADKGNATVIMDKLEYETKMENLLQSGPYQEITNDTNYKKNIEDTYKDYLKTLHEKEKITTAQLHYLSPNLKSTPILYGNPKIHKLDTPLRPIIDYRDTTFFNLAMLLKKPLQTLSKDHKHSLKNSYQFVEDLKTKKLKIGEVMVSFDVVSMFTKIPIQETLDFIEAKLKSTTSWKSDTKLDVDEFMSLLNICIKNTYFSWRTKLYKQLEGSPMGSPISPIFAELFMQFLKEQIVKNNKNIKFWRRFVDDIFSIIQARKAKQILKLLNEFHPSIQFTIEYEQNDSLPFLDVMVYKKENGIMGHRVYRKNTHTNQYLHYNSFHHPSQKISVIDSLVTRALKLSDDTNMEEELKFVTDVLIGNHFPKSKITSRINYLRETLTNSTNKSDDNKWIALPFTGSLCKRLSRLLRKNLDVKIGYFAGTKLSSLLFNFKDKKEKVNCGIYKIKCKQCADIYIGESGRDILTRLEEHEAHIRKNRVQASAVALHMAENPGHEIDKASFKLIEIETRYFHRKIKEALYIKKSTNTMNTNNGIKINSIWTPTILPFIKNP